MNQTATSQLPQPGWVIRGKYRVVRLVGEGGMGVVYEAVHLRLGQTVAIKVLQPARDGRRDAARFLREARAASQLQSSHVARVLDVDELPNGLPFMVMEFLQGRDLDEELGQRGRLGIAEAVDYVLQTCEAVAEAHARGIVHRDLKPGNLFICDFDDERLVKVLDFGISKMADEVNVTLTCTALGTPLYMSPEQIRNAKEVDHRTDIWSLGVILFELIAGQPPFEPEGGATAVSVAIAVDPPPFLRSLRRDVPVELEQIVMRMLEKDVSRRHQIVAEVAEALSPFASNPTLPGHVRVSELPRVVSSPVGRRARPTPSTVSHLADSAWTTSSRKPAPARFIYYLGAAAAFVLGGGVTAALLVPSLLAADAAQPAAAPSQPVPEAQSAVPVVSIVPDAVLPEPNGSAKPTRARRPVAVPRRRAAGGSSRAAPSARQSSGDPAPRATTGPRTGVSTPRNPIRL